MFLNTHLFIIAATCIIAVSTGNRGRDCKSIKQIPKQHVGGFKPRIVGGFIPRIHSLPFVAYLMMFDRQGNSTPCTGSIIAPRYVLTALHCLIYADSHARMTLVEVQKRMIVKVGSLYKEKGRKYSVVAHYMPPIRPGSDFQDIVLLKLNRAINFIKGKTAPVVLGRWLPKVNETLTIAGHGDRVVNGRGAKVSPYVLANVTVLGAQYNGNIVSGFWTYGDGEGASPGDSGGPALKVVNGQYVQVGMIAVGGTYDTSDHGACVVGLYLAIAPYCDFIQTKTNGAARCRHVD
uniref:Peptidase S1 domain-containing protein n=1 Tax=Panagrellus redivivus TaxID=6233 RepID=A0A7E4UTY9_PANRE